MSDNIHKHIKLIKDHLCDDLDAQACKELMDVIKTNPEVRIYFDTVKKTISLCKNNDCPKDLPADINQRLFEALGLDNKTKNEDKEI